MWGYILSLERNSYSIFLLGEPRAVIILESQHLVVLQGNERMWNNSLNDVNTVVSNFENLYEVINQANLMINKVEGMSMNESTKRNIITRRSLWYPCFPLLSVVTILEMLSDMDRFLGRGRAWILGNLARPASSAADVMKLIVDDLQLQKLLLR